MDGQRQHAAEARNLKPGRNDPCPCGSGRKYKQCCAAAPRERAPAAVSPTPRFVDAEFARARALREAADFPGAAAVLEQVLRLAPNNAVALNELGLIHFHTRRMTDATRCFERAVALDPKLAIAHYHLGAVLEWQGDDTAAIGAFGRAAGLDPKLAEAHERFGNLLLARGNQAQALERFRHVARIASNSTQGRLSRARVLHEEGRAEEAETCLRRAIALDPASAAAHRFLGHILIESGRFEEAAERLERAIALAPEEVGIYCDLVQFKRITEADRPLIERILACLEGSAFAEKYRADLHFALGKAFDDLGDYAQAIDHFDEANRIIHRASARPDRGRFAVGINRLITGFTQDFFKAHAALGTDSETPVLILGMPRSGTTLVEQILSRHREVASGGELTFWHMRAEAYARSGDDSLSADYMGKLAADYLALLRQIGPDVARVTDKMPINFLWIGLIHLVFPKAYIIHCRRDPLDTCLSIYFTRFGTQQEFAYDRGDLVFYYRNYARLMAHWREVVPSDRFLDVDYEELIANREDVTRRLVGFVGLDWDEACLRPEENRRVIKTASAWQARQPVYNSSVGRWRNYEPWLGELQQLLVEADRSSTSASPQRRLASTERQTADRLLREGKVSEAIAVLHRAIRIAPEDPAAFNDLGLLLLYSHHIEQATGCFEQASALDPNFAVAHYNLAVALERQRRRGEAIAAYRRAIALDQNLAAAHSKLGDLLHAMGARAEALDCFTRAAAASPDTTLGRLNRAKLLLVEDKLAEAEQCLRDTIAHDPQSSEAHRLLGNILREAGRFDEATTHLDRAIDLDPELISAYHDLIQSKKVTEADRPLLARMSSLLEVKGFTDHERTLLHFALGKAFDDLAAYEQAIAHFDAGNRLERAGLSFDRARFAEEIDRRIAGCTPDFFAANARFGSDCATPVLILGMPRSGTTLVEQILSSHPQVAAAGELMFWQEHAAALADSGAGDPAPSSLGDLAAQYLSDLRRVSPDAVRVIDKMPFNFLHLGLIHSACRNAFIIHCRRNPIDTCLSIYFTRFATRQEFAYDRGDLVFYYQQYARLMKHWREVLPAARFLDVDYEDLITNSEEVSRRLIAFIGLDWDEACQRPQDNPRVVKTASSWQARQPIYETSVERWRHYEPWLGELRLLLSKSAKD
jgi:tetratricopeptide (TPR) repeat protein